MSDFTRNAAQMLFQHSLAEVVRKLRSTTGQSEEEAVEQYLADTKKEVCSATQSVKVIAVEKATYFHMLGYSASYAAFNIVEVMADPIFSHKRVGYVAACTTFTEDTEVIPLLTALLKRDLCSSNQYEAGMALYCISSICTPDLAKDVVSDVVKLLNHPRTYVRKKAVLSLYKIFLQFPESLRPTYPRLKDKLDDNSEQCDADPAVRGAVVCVLCELARRNPANFLGLAVPFYSLLSSVQSNWTLIKIVKVFGYFAPVEPRLGKKLVEPLTNLILTTGATSVQYECLLAVANGMSKVPALTKLAAEKLRSFVEDRDPNLKFLGLDAMARLARENAKLLMDQRQTVLACLDNSDVTIRCKALEVLRDLVTKKTIVSTIDAMLDRCVRDPVEDAWSNAVIACIVETAQTDDYGLVQDFEWYLGILLEISEMTITEFAHGTLVEHEIVTILTRVNGARQFGVESLSGLLSNSHLLRCSRERSTQWMILRAAAFACGEYPYWLLNKKETCRLLLSEAIALLPSDAQVACVTAVGKIAAFIYHPSARHLELKNGEEELSPSSQVDPTTYADVKALVDPSLAEGESGEAGKKAPKTPSSAPQGISLFSRSVFPDVQERTALTLHQILEAPDVGATLYEKELLPVAEGAQDALDVPPELDFDKPFCENVSALMVLSESEHSSSAHDSSDDDDGDGDDDNFGLAYRVEQQKRMEKARRAEVSAFYLRDDGSEAPSGERSVGRAQGREDAVDERFNCAAPSSLRGPTSSRLRNKRRHDRTGTGGKAQGINRDLVRPAAYVGPSGATSGHGKGNRRTMSPEEDEATKKLRNIDVTRTLGADETLPEAVPYALLLHQASAGGGRGRGLVDSAVTGEPAPLAPVTLFEEKRGLRAVLHVDSCKVKKDGTHLRFTLEVANLAVTSALHDVTLTLAESDSYPRGAFALIAADKEESEDHPSRKTARAVGDDKHKEAAEADDASSQSLLLEERVKGSATTRSSFALRLPQPLPDTLLPALPLTLEYVKEKKRSSATVEIQLHYVHFVKRSLTTVDREDFATRVLAAALADAPVLSAFIPCSKTALLYCAPLVQTALQLAPMDIFKDAATFYGLLHGRKSLSKYTHVAVLLREAEEDGSKGVSVSVRTHATCLAELLVQDVSTIIQAALVD